MRVCVCGPIESHLNYLYYTILQQDDAPPNPNLRKALFFRHRTENTRLQLPVGTATAICQEPEIFNNSHVIVSVSNVGINADAAYAPEHDASTPGTPYSLCSSPDSGAFPTTPNQQVRCDFCFEKCFETGVCFVADTGSLCMIYHSGVCFL